MKLRFRKTYIAIGILVIIAVMLTIAIGFKYYSLRKPVASKADDAILPASSPTPPLDIVDKLLDTPFNDASKEKQNEYYELVKQYARTAVFLDISDCRANPTVLIVSPSKPVQIKNTDDSTHEIALNKDTHFIIPAKSSESYAIPFNKGPGVYGFGCDKSGKTAGLFFVKS